MEISYPMFGCLFPKDLGFAALVLRLVTALGGMHLPCCQQSGCISSARHHPCKHPSSWPNASPAGCPASRRHAADTPPAMHARPCASARIALGHGATADVACKSRFRWGRRGTPRRPCWPAGRLALRRQLEQKPAPPFSADHAARFDTGFRTGKHSLPTAPITSAVPTHPCPRFSTSPLARHRPTTPPPPLPTTMAFVATSPALLRAARGPATSPRRPVVAAARVVMMAEPQSPPSSEGPVTSGVPPARKYPVRHWRGRRELTAAAMRPRGHVGHHPP